MPAPVAASWPCDWFFGKGLADKHNLPTLVIKEAHLDFIKPARLGDVLIIKTHVSKSGNSFIIFEHEVYNEENNMLLCKAQVFAVHIGPDFKPKRMPERIKMEVQS